MCDGRRYVAVPVPLMPVRTHANVQGMEQSEHSNIRHKQARAVFAMTLEHSLIGRVSRFYAMVPFLCGTYTVTYRIIVDHISVPTDSVGADLLNFLLRTKYALMISLSFLGASSTLEAKKKQVTAII